MDDGLRELKRKLRAEMKRRLASLNAGEIVEKSGAVVRAVEASGDWERADVVLAFLPLPGEADLRPLIADSLEAGKMVGLPRIDGDDLVFHAAFGPAAGLVRHVYGMLEPPPGAPVLRPEDLAGRKVLVLAPGLAFDRRGGRLGRGRGFYDRFLRGLVSVPKKGPEAGSAVPGSRSGGSGLCALGVGFACQLVDGVPMGTEDLGLDGVATEEGLVPKEPA